MGQWVLCQDESDSPRSYEGRSPRNTKQQINKTVPRGRFFLCFFSRLLYDFFGNDVSRLEIENRNEVLMTSMACFVIEISAFVSMADGRCQ